MFTHQWHPFRCCNTADKKSQDVQAKIDQGVSAIRSSSEYQAFIEQNKRMRKEFEDLKKLFDQKQPQARAPPPAVAVTELIHSVTITLTINPPLLSHPGINLTSCLKYILYYE